MLQLSLFEATPDLQPAPTAVRSAEGAPFYVGGWKVWWVGLSFGLKTDYGWHLARIDGPRLGGAHGSRALRDLTTSWAHVAGLPNDLYARGWERDRRPGYEHWLHWPGNGVACCLDTLEQNIAAARQQRAQTELLAQAQARRDAAAAKQQQPTKRKKAA